MKCGLLVPHGRYYHKKNHHAAQCPSKQIITHTGGEHMMTMIIITTWQSHIITHSMSPSPNIHSHSRCDLHASRSIRRLRWLLTMRRQATQGLEGLESMEESVNSVHGIQPGPDPYHPNASLRVGKASGQG